MTVVFCHNMSCVSKDLPEKIIYESQPEWNKKEGKGNNQGDYTTGQTQ